MTQIRPITEQLKKTEGMKIPMIELSIIQKPEEERTGPTPMDGIEVQLLSDNDNSPAVVNNSMFANVSIAPKPNGNTPTQPDQGKQKVQKPASGPSTVVVEAESKAPPPWLAKTQPPEVKKEEEIVVFAEDRKPVADTTDEAQKQKCTC
jgi:hypothetical protein